MFLLSLWIYDICCFSVVALCCISTGIIDPMAVRVYCWKFCCTASLRPPPKILILSPIWSHITVLKAFLLFGGCVLVAVHWSPCFTYLSHHAMNMIPSTTIFVFHIFSVPASFEVLHYHTRVLWHIMDFSKLSLSRYLNFSKHVYSKWWVKANYRGVPHKGCVNTVRIEDVFKMHFALTGSWVGLS